MLSQLATINFRQPNRIVFILNRFRPYRLARSSVGVECLAAYESQPCDSFMFPKTLPLMFGYK